MNEDNEIESEASEEEADPQVESEARAQGWVPKSEFRGPEDKWVDAATFLDKAQNILPIVKASNRKLQDQVGNMTGQIRELQTQLRAANESIAVLKQVHDQQSVNDAKDARRDLQVQRAKAAREENDDLVAELDDKIKDLDDSIRDGEKSIKEAKTKPKADQSTTQPQSQEYKDWAAANPWWGTDEEVSDFAVTKFNSLKRSGWTEGKSQTQILNEVTRLTRKVYPNLSSSDSGEGEGTGRSNDDDDDTVQSSGRRKSKTGGGMTPSDTGGGNGSRRSKGYDSLPPEAKRFCQKTASTVVGKGRAFDTLEAYQKHYAKEYFRQNPEG